MIYIRKTKTLLNDFKELHKWRVISLPWTGNFNIVKIPILSNLAYTFNKIPMKIPVKYFAYIKK
jgi:hypothetical protein